MVRVLSWDVGIKNLAFCILRSDDDGGGGSRTTVEQWSNLSLCNEGEKCKHVSLEHITRTLLGKLDEHPEFLEMDYVLIENQPCMKNPMMKNIQIIIYTYFQYKHVHGTSRPCIQFVSALNKMKLFKGLEYPRDIESIKNKYSQKKKKAIFMCSHIFENHGDKVCVPTDIEEYFTTSRKKDDLADAFLYSVWFLVTKIDPGMFLVKMAECKETS